MRQDAASTLWLTILLDCGCPLKIVLLASPESWYRRDLERAAAARGHEAHCVPFERLAASVSSTAHNLTVLDQALHAADAVLVRTMPPGSLEQVIFRMNLLGQLEARGIAVVNSPRAIECAVDKYLTTARLQAAGLPTPPTITCQGAEDALAAFEQLGGDVVVKPLFGSEGRGILRVSDRDLALRVFRTLERIDAVLYLQQFIEHPGHDVRVLVLDGKVIASMQRHSRVDFRTNISRDGSGEPHELTAQEADWATRAAHCVGARIAGIDLLYDRRGNGYVIEVNGVPGWKALSRVTGCDVADRLIEALE